ncbi:MAG: hypothetical protein WC119_02245 [Synergistaceae bacterium]
MSYTKGTVKGSVEQDTDLDTPKILTTNHLKIDLDEIEGIDSGSIAKISIILAPCQQDVAYAIVETFVKGENGDYIFSDNLDDSGGEFLRKKIRLHISKLNIEFLGRKAENKVSKGIGIIKT